MVFPSIFSQNFNQICRIEQNQIYKQTTLTLWQGKHRISMEWVKTLSPIHYLDTQVCCWCIPCENASVWFMFLHHMGHTCMPHLKWQNLLIFFTSGSLIGIHLVENNIFCKHFLSKTPTKGLQKNMFTKGL